ncbi:MAG TPA: dTDP-4-dehydrorhamnose reductase [Candidatus Limnocylindria bacterium]|nr:dTDP-4-dehydrorhamnose reductase [Candidatus Limnocylindria bacterium]
MKVLVTGAGGMLGQSLMRALETAGHHVLALTRADGDVTRLESLRHPAQALRPDWIFHLAAYTRVDDCELHADQAYLVNGLGARNAALVAAEVGAAVLVISSDYVFDGRATRPYREYDMTGPLSVYGASKLAGERAVREVHARHLIVRTAWLYGRGGRNFIDTILRKARAGEPLQVVDDQRGAPTSTRDLSQALIRLAETGQYGTYHCTNSGECTWHELATYAVGRAGLATAVGRVDSASLARPAQRPSYSVLSNLLFEHVTGTRMPHWQDAVDRYLKPAPSHAGSSGSEGR